MTNISKQEKLSILILLTLSITSISSYANVNNLSLQKINNKEMPTKLNPQYKLSRTNPQEKKTIRFSQLKELLKQNNENLKVIESQIEQSKNILNSKIAAWSPRLKIRSNEIPKYITGDTRNKFLENSSSNQLKVGVDSTFEWDIINPKRRLEIKIAKDKLENLSDIYQTTYKDLYLEVLKVYYSIQSSKEEIKVAEKSIEISEVALNEAKNRFKNGLGNKLDLLESKTQLHRNQLGLIKKSDQYNTNLNKLGEILSIKNDFFIEDDYSIAIDSIWFADQKESETAAFKNRLDMEIKRRNIKINDNESLVVIADKKPNLNLYNTFSISSANGETGVTSPNFSNVIKSNTNTVGLSFNWNLFDGGNIKQNFLSLKEKNIELESELKLKKNEIRKEIKDTLNQYEMIKKNIILAYKQLNSAKESLEISLKRMEAGITTQREVVNTQGDVLESETNYINALKSYKITIAELQRLTNLEPKSICSDIESSSNLNNMDFINFLNEINLIKDCNVI
tara:strand:+ start:228 stop:1757 length:1530 start_codon:yes stop_codon:yes gene_type:complete